MAGGIVTRRISEVFTMSARKRRKLPVWHFRLADVLKRKRWTQGELCRRTGLLRVQVTAMCNKPCNPTWKTILRIVTYTGWELKEFLPEGVSEADLAADPKKAGVA